MTWRPRYHCAPTLFRDEMARGLTAPPPYDHCKTTPDVVDVDALVRYAAARANASAIDALVHLRDARVWLYRGRNDATCVVGTASCFATPGGGTRRRDAFLRHARRVGVVCCSLLAR